MEAILDRAIALMEDGHPPRLVTVIRGQPPLVAGTRVLLDDHGFLVLGTGSPAADEAILHALGDVSAVPGPTTIHLPGDILLFVDQLRAESPALICGAGHIAVPLARFLRELHFQVTVLDDRAEYANRERFPGCKVLVQPFTSALRAMRIPPDCHVVVITRGHEHDVECLCEILPHETAYVGLIGSRRRVALVLKNLQESGIPRERLDDLFSPIGLPIGSDSPEDIAMSIASEILCVRTRGAPQARRLRDLGDSR